jgi:hypothetical protein
MNTNNRNQRDLGELGTDPNLIIAIINGVVKLASTCCQMVW